MRFTKLRLQGFKSFVDPTEVAIREGLTGVVGPNGCGKSNLLEALRWVMGESRARAMRGEGMADVVFAGSAARPARASAQVSIVIEDPDGRAPEGLRGAGEIEVSRRITRDLGSAYAINGRPTRARDVATLFADAATGAQSAGLVRQGQIGELISARPATRRRVLEEAAGIAGLHQRRQEAEGKLSAAAANLARVDDLIDGLEGQLRSLSRQAAQARRYREVAAALRRAEAVVLLIRWREAVEGSATAEAAEAEAARAAARAEAEAQAARRACEAPEAALPELREEVMVAEAVLARARIAREEVEREAAQAGERIAALAAALEAAGADLVRERALGTEARESIDRLAAEARELRADEEGHAARLEAATVADREAASQLADRETEHDRLAEQAAAEAGGRDAAAKALAEAEARRKAADAEAAQLAAERVAVGVAAEAAERAAGHATAMAAAAREATRAAVGALESAEAARARAAEAETSARETKAAVESARSALRSEIAALERIAAADEAGPADAEPMVARLRVAPGYEAALGAALGDDLLAPAEAPSGGNGWGEPGDGGAAPLPDGVEALAARVSAPERLGARLAATGVVSAEAGDALQARLVPGQRLVSREGDLWRWDGFRRRAGPAPEATARRLERDNRLAALSEEAAEAGARHASAAERHGETVAALARAEAALKETRARMRSTGAEEAEAVRAEAKATAELDRLTDRSTRLAEATKAAEARAGDAQTAEAEARERLATLPDPAEALAARDAARAALAEMRRATVETRARLDQLRRDASARERRLAAIRRETRAAEERATAAELRVAELTRRIAATEADRAAAAVVPETLAERRAETDRSIAAAESRTAAARGAVAEGEAALRRAETAAREAETAAGEAREDRVRSESAREVAAGRLREAAEVIDTELGVAPEALAEETAELELPDGEAARTEAARLRRQRDALGAVNLRAEEDARAVTEERDRLAAEKADLEGAIAKLRAGVAALNREGRARLLAAFEDVDARFRALFQTLFEGGEARLSLVDSEDPLEAGLEILCQPPGKTLSSLSLLSGGEQTLTALSLIFAVFLCNPAPVCVLDEVDAPLDDANVARFCALLDEMVARTTTRFLVITHHALTMSRMDRLYGVTMIEPGVSRLVSVDLAAAEALVDA